MSFWKRFFSLPFFLQRTFSNCLLQSAFYLIHVFSVSSFVWFFFLQCAFYLMHLFLPSAFAWFIFPAMRIFSNSFFPANYFSPIRCGFLWRVFCFFFWPEKCLFLTYFWFHLRKRYIYIFFLRNFPAMRNFLRRKILLCERKVSSQNTSAPPPSWGRVWV